MNFKDFRNIVNKVLVFYKPGSANYWHSITRCNITEKPKQLGKYYLDFTSKAQYPGPFDSVGIPLYSFSGQLPSYHPIVICQYAFALYELLSQSNFTDEVIKNKFLMQARWLVDNRIVTQKGTIWQIHYDIEQYGLISPWYSALVQGEAVSVLSRAYVLTKEKIFLIIAKSAITPLKIPVANGGLLAFFKNIPVFEEYPSPYKTNGVLNGFIFCLFGLYDLTLLNQDSKAMDLFNKGIGSIKQLLSYYDLGYWSRYYLFDYPNDYVSSFSYHMIVIEQLKVLFILTGDDIFSQYASKWQNQADSIIKKTKALVKKILYAKTIV